jgi:transcriptional regulator with GAF, ATPase, and Fis domain
MAAPNEPRHSPITVPITVSQSIGSGSSDEILDLFQDLTRRLRVRFPIDRAVLIVGNRSHTEYRATACFAQGRQQHLSLTLPGESSLLQQVAAGGCIYTESFCALFSGNDIERDLLLDGEAEALAIVPIKCDAVVVGLIGFSSHDPHAFSMFEEEALGSSPEALGQLISAGL